VSYKKRLNQGSFFAVFCIVCYRLFWVVFSLCIVCIFNLFSVLNFPACTNVNGIVWPHVSCVHSYCLLWLLAVSVNFLVSSVSYSALGGGISCFVSLVNLSVAEWMVLVHSHWCCWWAHQLFVFATSLTVSVVKCYRRRLPLNRQCWAVFNKCSLSSISPRSLWHTSQFLLLLTYRKCHTAHAAMRAIFHITPQ